MPLTLGVAVHYVAGCEPPRESDVFCHQKLFAVPLPYASWRVGSDGMVESSEFVVRFWQLPPGALMWC
jgi:hypothetical protein